MPVAAAGLVLCTYWLGATLWSGPVGFLAAVLLATSPPFVLQALQPMSDVPAAFWWTLALTVGLSHRRVSLVAAAAATGLAIATRPNLAPIGLLLSGLLFVIRRGRSADIRVHRLAWLSVCAGTIGGAVIVGLLNEALYGSPFNSGYGSLVGQEHITNTLKNAIKEKRIAHAYLFTGPRGVGKTTTARILAKTLNCENRKNSEPCNECDMCKSIQNSQLIDIIEIDGASNRGIDEIRSLRDSVKYAPTRGNYKVYIIDEVHMLTKEPFNAFLKTLEEPPEHIIFIFATTDVHKVPLTIISRCQRYDFRRIQLDKIKETLPHELGHRSLHEARSPLRQPQGPHP